MTDLERAVRAYNDYNLRNGYVATQPSMSLSSQDGDQIVLANITGELARYRLTARRRLVRMRG